MASVNKVILIGHLGQDPDVRSFQNGGRVANLRLATSESWKDKRTGERQERTEWHSVAILNDGLVGVAERYLRKGSKVYIEGQLRTRKWKDQSGNDRYTTEVAVMGMKDQMVMLDRNPASGSGGGSGGSAAASGGADSGARGESGFAGSSSSSGYPDLDDEVPF